MDKQEEIPTQIIVRQFSNNFDYQAYFRMGEDYRELKSFTGSENYNQWVSAPPTTTGVSNVC